MKDLPKWLICIFLWVIISALMSATNVKAEDTKEAKSLQPMVIESDFLEVNDLEKIVTFVGKVNAKKENFRIDCDKMLVYYTGNPAAKNQDMGAGIDKIVAIGNVKITRTEGGLATAQKAIYYQKDEKIVLTGNPVVKQGEDFVEGQKITIYLKDNKSIVEGSDNKKVKAVIYPKKEGK